MSLHKNIRLLSWFNFFSDFRLYAPIAIIYFAKVTHSYTLGVSIFSLTMLAAAILELPTGIFSDYIGRKNTVVAGALASVVSVIFYAIGLHFWILAVGAVFEGLARSFFSGNNEALLHDSLVEVGKKDEYHVHLGKTSSWDQIGLGAAAILGGILAAWSFGLVMWVSVIPQIVCLFISFNLTNPKVFERGKTNIYAHLKESLYLLMHNKSLRLVSLADIARNGMGESAYQFQAAFYNTVLPLWAIGMVKVLSNTFAAASFHFSGKILNKFDKAAVLLYTNIYSRVINTIALVVPTPVSPFLMTTTSLSFGMTSVARSSLMQREFTNEQRATMGSLNSLGGSIFFAIFSFGIGFVADKLGPAKSLLLVQVCMLPIIWIYWKLFHHEKKLQESTQPAIVS